MKNNIDELYDKVINMPVNEKSENKLTDQDMKDIMEAIDEIPTDDTLAEAKQAAVSSDLKDTGVTAEVVYNPETGKPMGVNEVDLDDESIRSFEDLLDSEGIEVPDVDIDKMIMKYAICSFFAIEDSDEALSNAEITDEVMDKVNEIIEKFKIYKKTGKKFSYYNAMPDPIKALIERFQGSNALTAVGNMNREARNYITACFMNSVIDCNISEVMADDLNKSIAKMNKEFAEDDAWGETRKYFRNELPELIASLEKDGEMEKAEKGRLSIASFNEACEHNLLCEAIPTLKIRHIDMEEFDKYCESFNDIYKNNTYQITDIHTAYDMLCKSTHFEEDEEVYKKMIGYFIEYIRKNNLDPNNIIDHVYMYYFIQNIITLDFYNPNNEEDVAFHNMLIENLNKLISVVKFKDITDKNNE